MHLENTDNSLFLHHTLDSANMSKKLYNPQENNINDVNPTT